MAESSLRRHHFAGKVHRSPAELPADQRALHVVKIGLHAHSRRNVFRIDDIPRFPPKALLETSDRLLFLVNEDGLVLVLDQRPDYVALERAGAVDRIVEDILMDFRCTPELRLRPTGYGRRGL